MNELLAGTAYFVFVFFKAFQQRNVAFMHYRWILPISYAMACTEVFVISLVAYEATQGISWHLLWFALTIGTGGGFGAVISMWVHHKYIHETDKPKDGVIRDASCLDAGCDIDGKEPHRPWCDHAKLQEKDDELHDPI